MKQSKQKPNKPAPATAEKKAKLDACVDLALQKDQLPAGMKKSLKPAPK